MWGEPYATCVQAGNASIDGSAQSNRPSLWYMYIIKKDVDRDVEAYARVQRGWSAHCLFEKLFRNPAGITPA